MASVFEDATRAAIEEILLEKFHESKHGYILTKEKYDELVAEIYRFFQASRNLKEAGDRLRGTLAPAGKRPKTLGGGS